jgi:hypothetical protein
MQARTISAPGLLFTRTDNYQPAPQVVTKGREKLFSISSNRNVVPWVLPSPQDFQKTQVRMNSGWSTWTVDDHVNPPSTQSKWGFQPVLDWMETWGGPSSAQETDSYNRAVADLMDKIRGSTDLSIDLAQFSKTRQIGHDCAKVALSLLKARNPINIIKAIGSARLTWVYGVKPTIQSIYDAVTFEAKHYLDWQRPYKGRGKSVQKWLNYSSGSGWPDYTYSCNADRTESVRDEIGVVLRIPDDPLTGLARLSSMNPVSIGWELMPFSFVIDWFVNIGGYVRDLETALVYDKYFVRGYRTQTKLSEITERGTRAIDRPYVGLLQPAESYRGHWSYTTQHKRKTRVLLYSFPYPKPPVFNCNLGSGRLLNAAALLSNFVSAVKVDKWAVQKAAKNRKIATQVHGRSDGWETNLLR